MPSHRGLLLSVVLALSALFFAEPVVALTGWRSATTNSGYEHVLRDLIAKEHYRVCKRSLAVDSRLVWMARYRATDMVLNKYFAHKNPWTGRKVWDLLRNAGISWSAGGENIVWNNYPDNLSPNAAMAQFMGSKGHRALIRSCTYTTFGVGGYKVGSKHMYAVIFLKP